MKINFAIIGTNWITEEFIASAKTFEEFNLKVVYSRNKNTAAAFAKKHNAEIYITDFDELCSFPKIDAVYIASPNSFHARQAIALMEKGKCILCEKPIASNQKELLKMIEVSKKNGVLLMEAMKSILMPNYSEIKKNICKLGPIRSVYANYSKYSSRYDAHKQGKNVNTFKSEFSNGALMDLGIYCLYPIVYLFGEPAGIKSIATKIPDGVDGAGTTILDYGNFTATVNYSKISNSYLPFEIQGENATMIIDKVENPRKFDIIFSSGTRQKEEFHLVQREDSMYYEIKEFLYCLKEGKTESETNSLAMSQKIMAIMDLSLIHISNISCIEQRQ